jgi:hypothetical protein
MGATNVASGLGYRDGRRTAITGWNFAGFLADREHDLAVVTNNEVVHNRRIVVGPGASIVQTSHCAFMIEMPFATRSSTIRSLGGTTIRPHDA